MMCKPKKSKRVAEISNFLLIKSFKEIICLIICPSGAMASASDF
jgi:hypothetical protein